MFRIFYCFPSLRRCLSCLLVSVVATWTVPAQQTRAVYKFQDNVEILSYDVLKARLDYIASTTISQYRTAFKASQDRKAEELLREMSDGVVMAYRISNCPDEVLESGWTEEQYRKVPELMKKVDGIMRRLKRIQQEAKRTAHTVLFNFGYFASCNTEYVQ